MIFHVLLPTAMARPQREPALQALGGSRSRGSHERGLGYGRGHSLGKCWTLVLLGLTVIHDGGSIADGGLAAAAQATESSVDLRDVSKNSGITFRHTDGSNGRHYIVETFASGMASVDYDGDGLLDLYFLNGRPLRGTPAPPVPPRNGLYRNLGDFRFQDVTDQAGVGDLGYGLGVCVGDFNNDGLPDLYVNNYGPNVLYRNNGDGTFTDVTAQAGVVRGDTVGAGANFLDIDGDGDLDLFVGNYVRFTYENHAVVIIRGAEWYAGPRDFPYQPNVLYRNNGEGTFTDISRTSGIADHLGPAMGTLAFDYDDDGDSDIFVCNDQNWNFLFQNDGKGRFREVGLVAGLACNYAGEPVGSMGADCGDCDHDGLLDLFMTDFQRQKPILFRNLGGGQFEDVTMRTGAGARSFPYVKWGCGLVDFDNDGYKDIFIGCGHLGPDLDHTADRTAYEVSPILLRNTGRGRFVDISDAIGEGAKVKLVARGVSFDDLDNDGRIDIAVLNSRRTPTVFRNASPARHHWLQVRLLGTRCSRDAVGARVRIQAGELSELAEIHSGRGYQSHFGTRLHFGLGTHHLVDRLEVRWPGGAVQRLENIAADQLITLIQASAPALQHAPPGRDPPR